jgi:hypothetical protein
MADSLTDLYTIAGIAAIGIGIFVAEEAVGFVIRRAAKRAGTSPTVLRDFRGH